MFTLIDGKGIPVLYCVCVYIYICGNTCVIVTGSCLVFFVYNKDWETMIQRSVSILDIYKYSEADYRTITISLEKVKI